jgi:SpoU rRNA methylase family enzyme
MDEGHALVGSPNRAAFAYSLMQHKAELGRKAITKVTVFRPEMDDDLAFVDPNVVFRVGDVEKENGNSEDDHDHEEMVEYDAQVRSARTYKL